MKSLGADEMIDCQATDFAAAVSDVDVVLDTVASGDYPSRSLRTLRNGGLHISLLPFPPEVLEEAAKAHELGEKRHVAGKLVLTVGPAQ